MGRALIISLLLVQGGSVLGTYRGRSTCVVGPPCASETVVYEIRRDSVYRDSIAIDADKIVNGVREPMGTLRCGWHAPQLECPMRTADWWRFTLRGDSLVGTLVVGDGRKYRDIAVVRAPAK